MCKYRPGIEKNDFFSAEKSCADVSCVLLKMIGGDRELFSDNRLQVDLLAAKGPARGEEGDKDQQPLIAHICHHWRWCAFFKPVPFLHREREIVAYFGQFGLFCCEFTQFLVYFYTAK